MDFRVLMRVLKDECSYVIIIMFEAIFIDLISAFDVLSLVDTI